MIASFVMASATAFSLICSGTTITRMDGQTAKEGSTSGTYYVDLTASRWCVDHCTLTFPIVSVSESVITLHKEVKADGGHILEINRRSGSYYSILLMKNYVMETDGQCVRGPFKSFSDNKF